MTSTEGPARAHDRHGRRRPFASWMKRLSNLKNMHGESSQPLHHRRASNVGTSKGKKGSLSKNNPYLSSGRVDAQANAIHSYSTPLSSQRSRHSSVSKQSIPVSQDGQPQPKSRAPTLATTAETAISDGAPSGAGTSATAPKTEGDRNSTFSSPAPSLRSMTTTLTTVQSAAPPQMNTTPINNFHTVPSNSNSTSLYPNQPHSAVPAHLAPHAHPTTYHSATANNVLTDDASILTLASSSKRRRRNSVDTNASVKALAPASMFGGSRESLPLSVLSGTIIHPGQADAASLRDASGSMYANSKLNAERASLISASGVTAPALASERNSYIGSRYGDTASVRSGLFGGTHGRNDSITTPTSPLAEEDIAPGSSNGHVMPDQPRALSRRSSDWAERTESRDR